MALKDVLKTPPPVRTGQRSKVEIWRDGLDEADRKVFDAAVRNPDWPASVLAKALKSQGLDVSGQAMAYYRRKVMEL